MKLLWLIPVMLLLVLLAGSILADADCLYPNTIKVGVWL